MTRSVLSPISLLLFLLPFLANAAQFYMVVMDTTSKPVTPGPALSPGAPENAVPILNFTFSASTTGRQATKGPFIVHREVDATSPVLLTTMLSNQVLAEVKIVALISGKPETVGFYYDLQRARITNLDTFAIQPEHFAKLGWNGTKPEGQLVERIQFSFEGLGAYYFDGKSSKSAAWGLKGKTGVQKENTNPLFDTLSSIFG